MYLRLATGSSFSAKLTPKIIIIINNKNKSKNKNKYPSVLRKMNRFHGFLEKKLINVSHSVESSSLHT